MVWTEKLKLNKQLTRSVTSAGLAVPKDIQLRSLARIGGGQDLIVTGPEGCGKTTTAILSALNLFRQGFEDAPRVLMLVPGKDEVMRVTELLGQLNQNKTIRVVGLYPAAGMEAQLDALADGADIVVATPDRARAIYLKLGLNLNKVRLLIIDDADLIVRQGLQLPVAELANSITRCQHLVFSEVIHDKLMKMIGPFMNEPAEIAASMETSAVMELHHQLVYHVPNFRTKQNLLALFLEDEELFSKVLVLVNNSATADKLAEELPRVLRTDSALFRQQHEQVETVMGIDEFLSGRKRILISPGDRIQAGDLRNLPFILHFELPEAKEDYIGRVKRSGNEDRPEQLFITFATDIELTAVSRIETATGIKIPVGDLPDGLRIDNGQTRERKTEAAEEQPAGAAFHQKKAANSKTYNYGSGVKARMNKKKKHG